MVSKNTICLWYDGTAVEAAQFYAETFPDSAVGTILRAPGDYPSGKEGDVLTVEFTVIGIPCIGLNGGPAFKHSRPSRSRLRPTTKPKPTACGMRSSERRPGKRMRLVQGQVGPVVADHAARPNCCDRRS